VRKILVWQHRAEVAHTNMHGNHRRRQFRNPLRIARRSHRHQLRLNLAPVFAQSVEGRHPMRHFVEDEQGAFVIVRQVCCTRVNVRLDNFRSRAIEQWRL